MRSKRLFLENLARDAGKLMMDYWQKDVDVYQKADQTIVTEVDLQISKIVCDRISKAYPESALLTEETHKDLYFPKETGFIIDELDCTFSFANGRSGFNFQCAYYEKTFQTYMKDVECSIAHAFYSTESMVYRVTQVI